MYDRDELETTIAVLQLIQIDFKSLMSQNELKYLQVAINYISEGIEKDGDGN